MAETATAEPVGDMKPPDPKQAYTEEVTGVEREASGGAGGVGEAEQTIADIREEHSKGWFAYLKTRDFYIVLLLG